MSTRDALIQKIQKQPDWVLKEVDSFLDSVITQQKSGASSDDWPEGYFQETAGIFANEPFERPPQLPFENREDW
jgi:hypothetical protein